MSLFLADQTALPNEIEQWCARWNWPKTLEHQGDLQLEWRDGILSLCHRTKRLPSVHIDFIELWRTTKISKQDDFAKAIGVRNGLRQVVDATAGLGGDLIKLLKLNCVVTAFEQSPVVFALLQDADRRARLDPRWVTGGGARLTLRFGEAAAELAQLDRPEVIYLDPMFGDKNKTALSKGEMQILQLLLSEPEEDQALQNLWQAAREKSLRRVVLKRSRLGEHLSVKPDLEFVGKSVRYDIWLKV